MSGELSLFGDDLEEEPAKPAPPARPGGQIADWLVDSVRQALDARGLADMAERQAAIESMTGRPVSSLQALTRAEALRIVAELRAGGTPTEGAASSWDAREGDTWIDRI